MTDVSQVAEIPWKSPSGIPILVADVLLYLVVVATFVFALVLESPALGVASGVTLLVALVITAGFYMVAPNQAAVLTLFDDYRGSDRSPGLRFANPLFRKHKISLRVRNFTTERSKVNDSNGNPIEIAAVVVWRVTDTALAVFGVDQFIDYVHTQSESAVRHLARSYPYDAFDDTQMTTLIGDTNEVNEYLTVELQERVDPAGVEVLESRITDLAYAPEIAEVMLRRQQAGAIVAARAKIVEGAVLMVQGAIGALAADNAEHAVRLDDNHRATFASNLMTVITSDQPATPIVNVGTLDN